MGEKITSESSAEKPLNLNNFWMYLPGGIYREYNSGNKESKQGKIISAMDSLLENEFSTLNAAEIYQNRLKANELVKGIQHSTEEITIEQENIIMNQVKQICVETDAIITPLFQRLVEMGFDETLLAR